ncbi:MAG: gliding motility-associated C-terminal domain-containing protein [Saprospiraceae bacterium]|nr:gliding motility-associated C-terminal domain-containing protein [Saprospiraceae bacterium]
MKYLPLLILFLLNLPFNIHAQKEYNIWYFGDRNGIDFNNGAPVPLFNGEMQTFEAAATICDEQGNLLFYSNGGGRDPNLPTGVTTGLIFNKEHGIMYDMSYTEGGGYSARQGALIIPKPAASGEYYLFTMEELEFDQAGDVPGQPQGRGLSYFEIDMNLNAGLGDVTIADERVYVPLYEGLSGTPHANGVNYWIVVADLGYPDNAGSINRFGVLEVSPTGVGDLVWTNVGSYYLLNPQTKISPNGKLLLSTRRLFSFDNATGAIQDLNIQLNPGGVPAAYGFSPNSRYVYFVMPNYTDTQLEILRYDLEAPNIQASEELIAIRPGTFQAGQMQMGPDGNLYFSEFSGSPLMSVINRIRCPNTESPTFEADLFSFSFTDFSLYYSLGNYNDKVFESIQDFTLHISPGDTAMLCDGNLELSAAIEDATYLWSTGAETASISVEEPGVYTLEATNFCGVAYDTVVVLGPADYISIQGDTLLCTDSTALLSLSGSENLTSFMWSTGETSTEIEITAGGTYGITGTDLCGNLFQTAILVQDTEAPVLNGIVSSADPCEGETTILLADFNDVPANYSWSNGSDAAQIEISSSGLYSLDLSNLCGAAFAELQVDFVVCDCDYQMASGFSPNADGLNDDFGLIFPCTLLASYELTIFDRWGEMVFSTKDPDSTWDGTKDGQPLPADTYAWVMRYQETDKPEIIRYGEISLFR